ncbi:hypothetical protein SH1V18_48420 [Vallitalea longa]|uniref:Uncharacterized protein n=1 Tax=Vallitalea longa TaxID=2936439 RepID=A0A9W5YE95_9FIRM|nr:hypothetical protein [Vallitalea longa]GKX32362.1 hypothetical protein SH1V18_48420 [Vallitalea longa]
MKKTKIISYLLTWLCILGYFCSNSVTLMASSSIKPTIYTQQNNCTIGSNEKLRVHVNTRCSVYLYSVKYPDVESSSDLSRKGKYIKRCTSGGFYDITLKDVPDGCYRLYAKTSSYGYNNNNISLPSKTIVQVDNTKPEVLDINVNDNEVKIYYNDTISPETKGNNFYLQKISNASSSVCVISDEDMVDYELIFDDYESDSKYTDRFVFSSFDNSMFTNTNGTPNIIGKKVTGKKTFHEVGKYKLEYQAQDNPVTNNNKNFDEYRKWSNKNNVNLLVHRRPIANLTVNYAPSKDKSRLLIYNMNGSGYDLDHMDLSNKGITGERYEWKKVGEKDYRMGRIPTDLPGTDSNGIKIEYIIRYRVKDIEGAWSLPVTFTMSVEPKLILNAKLKTYKTDFSLDSIPASESLVLFDTTTSYNKRNLLDMSMYYYGSCKTDKIKKDSTYSATKNGMTYTWRDTNYKIPKTLKDGRYKFIVNATDYNNSAVKDTKEFNVRVKTPVDLESKFSGEYEGGNRISIPAKTSKYADNVTLELFYGTNYKTTINMRSINYGSYKKWTANYNIPENVNEGNYKAKFTATTPNGNTSTIYKNFRVNQLNITKVNIWGDWQHWRGQIDLFGKRLVNMPHRFMAYENVHIEAQIKGNPDRVYVRFSPSLEAMFFRNKYGQEYKYRDHIGYEVNFPLYMTSTDGKNYSVEYILPLADSTMDENDRRLKGHYWVEVTAIKGSTVKKKKISDIDITGNILDKVYIQPE